MENIDAGRALHRAFSVFLFNSKYELLPQVSHLPKWKMIVCIAENGSLFV